MQKIAILGVFTASIVTCSMAFAQELSGFWQQIDDKTGSPKALIEMKTQADGSYTGTITKVTPRPGYTPREKCVKCPPPYTDKPILGLDVIKGLKPTNKNNYAHGRVLDPLTGKIYDLKGAISANGQPLALSGYIRISRIGRTTTGIRQD